MKILVYEKYKALDDRTIEFYKIYYGKDEGEYFRNDHFTEKKELEQKQNI